MKALFYFIVCIGLIACNTARVTYDYDTKKDFSVYKTYNYFPELNTGLGELDTKRLLKVTDSIMETKGFTKSNTPQLYVNFKSKQYSTPSQKSFGLGVGTGPVSIGGNIPFGAPNQRIQLIVDFIDVAKDELVWQAEINDTQNSKFTPENRMNFFKVVMGKALHEYPPKKK